jgi:hypothetical protein
MFKKPKQGSYCPLIKKNCIENECTWYTHIRGTNPNTGEDVDHWGCAVSWLPMLTIENSQQQRSTGSAIESFRNEVVKANEQNRNLYIQETMRQQVLPVNVTPLTNNLTLSGEQTNENDDSQK